MSHRRRTSAIRKLLGATIFTLAAWSFSAGAQSVWDGGGADADWTTGANWTSNTAPTSSSSTQIQFAGSTNPAPNADIPYSISSITFNVGAGVFSVTGNQLNINSGINNASVSDQTVGNSLVFTAANLWRTTSTGDLTIAGPVDNGGFGLTVTPAAATTITVSGNINGAGSLAMNGAGTLALSLANGYSGGTTISAGTIQLGLQGSLGQGSVTASGNSILQVGASFADADITNNIAINSGVTLTIDANDFNSSWSGVVSGAGTLEFISSSGSVQPIVTMEGTNTYTGGTLIGDGGAETVRVVISGDSNLGAAAGGVTLNFGQLRATSDITTSRNFALATGGNLIMADNGKTYNISGVVSGASDLFIGGSTFGDVTVNHNGTVQLSGVNTFVGDIGIGMGTLAITADNNLGNAANDIFFNSYSAAGDNTTASLSLNATMTLGAGRSFDISNTAGDTAIIHVSSGAIATINGVISGTASGTLEKQSAGTLVLAGVNTYTGTTLVSAGTLQLSGVGATAGNGTAMVVSSGATFDANSVDNTVGSLAGAGNVTLGTATQTIGSDGTDTTFSGVISGAGNIVKTGAGTLSLTGANTYTGTTTINVGAISAQNATALGTTAAGTVVANGAALQLFGGITVGAEALTLNGTGVGATGALVNVDNNNTWGGAITQASASTIGSSAGNLTITGNIGGAFGLTFTGAGNTSVSGIIGTGANTLTKTGSGTLTLTGVNTFSGQVDIQEGTVAIDTVANGGAASALGASAAGTPILLGAAGTEGILEYTGSAAGATDRTFTVNGAGGGRINNTGTGALTLNGDIDNGGNPFAIGGTGNTTLNGVLSGAGALTKDGSGTVVLGGANTYTGATTVSAGTLQLNGAGTLGVGSAVTVSSGATLDLNGVATAVGSLAGAGNVTLGAANLTTGSAGTSTTFSGVISGAGGLIKNGAGTFTLSGANTYDGVTTINVGAINVQNASALGSAVGATTVVAGAALQIQGGINLAGEALTLNGTGGGNGALRNISGNNTVGGAITLGAASRINSDAGTLTLSGNTGGAFGLTIGGVGNTTVSGVIGTGAGTLTKDGTGTLTLTGLNTFTGQVDIQNGTVLIDTVSNGGVASSLGASAAGTPILLGSAGSQGTLQYAGSAAGATDRTFTVNGAGGGRINNTGSGLLTLNGAIDNGGNPFAIGGTGSTTLVGVLSGAGALTKDGSGTLTFDGVHTYAGNTTVSAGELILAAGSSANNSDFTIDPGAILSGFGSVQGLTNNGRVNVGDATTMGTVTVATGNYAGVGTVRLKVNGAGLSDTFAVTAGTATLTGGRLQPQLIGGTIPVIGSTINNVVTAGGGIVGTFDTVGHAAPVLACIPTYNAGSVDITFQRDLANPELNLDSAQLGLATSLTQAELTAPTTDLTTVLDAITGLMTADEVKAAYDQILPRKLDQMAASGYMAANVQTGNAGTRMNNLRFGVTPRSLGFVDNTRASWNYDGVLVAQNGDLFNTLRGVERLRYEEMDDKNPWGIFAMGSALFGKQDQRVDVTAYDFTAIGATLGVDYHLTDDLAVGLAAGYNYTKTDIDNNGGKAKIDTLSMGPYATYQMESLYFDGMVGYSRNFYDMERNINFATINRTATGSPEGDQIFGYLGTGYDFKIKDFITGPVGTVNYTRIWIDGYTETGADALNLDISQQTAQSLQSGIGWHWAYVWKMAQDRAIIPNLTITWQHEYMNDSRNIDAKIAGGTSFQTPTGAPRRDFANVSCGVNAQLTEAVSLSLGYVGQFGDDTYTENGVTGGVRVGF